MPTISPSLIPTKSAGNLLESFTGGDESLNVRWIQPTDPVFYEVTNRPIADVVVRQLVIAKALDNLQLQLGYQTLYPFIVQPVVASGSNQAEVPSQWIWDFQASLPKKWENLRLAKIKRMSGTNGTTAGYSGVLRCIFTANLSGSSTEVAIFYADYEIDSDLTYQQARLLVVDDTEEAIAINSSEADTVAGFIILRTLNPDLATVSEFYDLVAPPVDTTDANSDGFFDTPAVYEIVDTVAGGPSVTEDFATSAVSHGTGLFTDSTWNPMPELSSDSQSWINSINYPFDSTANRRSVDNITIPTGIFKEFDICAPAGDAPTDDVSGTYYPVWISRIESSGTNELTFYFSTYNTTTDNPSIVSIEFASLVLTDTMSNDQIVEITPINDLLLDTGTSDEFQQGFGRGHVVLSNLWDGTSSEVTDFFDAVDALPTDDTIFSRSSTRLSSFGISRVPKYVPTIGQSAALRGSSARLSPPVHPDDDNRFITEADQGLGDTIDLEAQSGINPNTYIDRYGYTGSLAHRVVKLVINSDDNIDANATFYTDQVLPRLEVLLGRSPVFGDQWFTGSRFVTFNGDTWVG